MRAEFCFDQSLNYGKDDGGCGAEHEHAVDCLNWAQQPPPGRFLSMRHWRPLAKRKTHTDVRSLVVFEGIVISTS